MFFQRLVMATVVLGLAGTLAWGGFLLVTRQAERRLGLGRDVNEWIGFLGFGAALAVAAGMMGLTMAVSPDRETRRALAAVIALVLLGLAGASVWRWSATHRHPGMRAWIERAFRAAVARAALLSFLIAFGGCVWTLRGSPAALAGFLAGSAAALAYAGHVVLMKFGWRPYPLGFAQRTMLGRARPRQAFRPAFAAAAGESLRLTPEARTALKEAYLPTFLACFGTLFVLFLPLVLAMRTGRRDLADPLSQVVLGVQGAALFTLLLPAMLLGGFVLGFVLLPLGLLRTAGGASGGAGASATIPE